MSSHQRRRGVTAKVWKTERVEDNRGNTITVAREDNTITVKAAFVPLRSARAELPGQAQINVVRMIVDPNLPDVDLWSKVEVFGAIWDVVTPPAYHHGTRHVRHWGIDLRQRP